MSSLSASIMLVRKIRVGAQRTFTTTNVALSQEGSSKKHRSQTLTGKDDDESQWVSRSPARAMLRAVRFSDDDFKKPIITVACPYTNATPCNDHIRTMGDIIAEKVEKAGGKPFVFGTPVISDGVTMGTEGMKYSLVSRDLITDCIETMHEGYVADGLIALSGCDKTIPASVMAIARTNAIGIALYGGTIRSGKYNGRDLNIVSAFEAVGQFGAKKIDKKELVNVECKSCPGPGSCGGMYTANTMATCLEAMGISLPLSSSNPATTEDSSGLGPDKVNDCDRVVQALMNLLDKRIRARDILTKKAFENAIVVMQALGGSTNAVLHLMAIAREAQVDLKIEDFNRISAKVPLIGNFKPAGEYLMEDHVFVLLTEILILETHSSAVFFLFDRSIVGVEASVG
eukprot:TRINITY_DN1193_c0_g1_i1.p1 TRINITY_DN1193_c0_g1~~TRINITY_DN1193_c0_g1_i1.p1  ORF type:complete len:400 (-),score=86.94 TRINITY_DN1193_c0_g1_i1:1532-2731(-)